MDYLISARKPDTLLIKRKKELFFLQMDFAASADDIERLYVARSEGERVLASI